MVKPHTMPPLTDFCCLAGQGLSEEEHEAHVATQGDTVDEARKNLQEALEVSIETASPEETEAGLHHEVYVTHLQVTVG
jgi:vacuolar-type H+-ATPase subunit D/Vma8